jgi:hypothetical protein
MMSSENMMVQIDVLIVFGLYSLFLPLVNIKNRFTGICIKIFR